MSPPSRRAIIGFLVALTLLVGVRLARSTQGGTGSIQVPAASVAAPEGWRPGVARPGGVTIRMESPTAPLAAASALHATLEIRGLPVTGTGLEVSWEARLAGGIVAAGLRTLTVPRGGVTRLVLSIVLPAVDRPMGMDLRVQLREGGTPIAQESLPLVLWPEPDAGALRDRLQRARIALYDPDRLAAPILRLLGVPHEEVPVFTSLALWDGDLIIVGPGGFSRGREDLGPILAARARSGMRILLLDQPTLPATLSPDLRLWPTWNDPSEGAIFFAADHPVLRGVPVEDRAGYFRGAGAGIRPLLPPTRGNFRIIAGLRVGAGAAGQEGVRLLELGIGDGTVLAAQSPLCAGFRTDPRARLLLVNALAHLLEERQAPGHARLYGRSVADLPACLGRLAPRLEPVGAGLDGTRVLLVPADWQAPRLAAAAGLPPVATVGRFLRDGGTVVLLDPQPLVRGYLEAIVGAAVQFEPARAVIPAAGLPFLDGIAQEDLEIFASAAPQMRLRSSGGSGPVEPLAAAFGFSAWRVGAGTLVVLSLPDSCDAARTRSLLARLFTNLGVPLDRPAAGPAAAATLLD